MLASLSPAFAQDREAVAIITSPTEGGVVVGLVEIRGSAGHPSAYAGYELEFDNLGDANEVWIPIGQRISQQVTDGILASWDTVGNRIPDGFYQIRLRVFLNDGSEPVEDRVTNVQVVNSPPTPLPTSQIEQPSPTPLTVDDTSLDPVLPPTSTPRPTSASAIVPIDTSGSDETSSGFTLNFSRLQSSFCFGAYIAIGFFILLGIYMWLRERLRPHVRQAMWQIRNEFDEDR